MAVNFAPVPPPGKLDETVRVIFGSAPFAPSWTDRRTLPIAFASRLTRFLDLPPHC